MEPGTFTMGQVGVAYAEPEHNVTLTVDLTVNTKLPKPSISMAGNEQGLSANSQVHGSYNLPPSK